MNDSRDTYISTAGVTAVPAGSTTVVLWDSTAGIGSGTTLERRHSYPGIRRAMVRVYMDQAATFKTDSLNRQSTTWRTYNGGGAGEAIAANTWFERDVFLPDDDHRLIIVTGTVPTVWEVSVRLCTDRALGQ